MKSILSKNCSSQDISQGSNLNFNKGITIFSESSTRFNLSSVQKYRGKDERVSNRKRIATP